MATIHSDHHGILAAVQNTVATRRNATVEELTLVLDWADLHTLDPLDHPDIARPHTRAAEVKGGDRLVTLGGEGTPAASELCWAEPAIARQAGVIATKNLAADALDLRHRLPQLYEQVHALRVEVWVARKVAAMTRPLTQAAAGMVDAAVAAAWQQPVGRLLQIAEAATIEADLEAHKKRLAEDAARVGVWRSRPRPGDKLGGEVCAGPGAGEAATGRITGKLSLGAVEDLDHTLEDLAEHLAGAYGPGEEQPTRDQLRAHAFGLLAHPAAAALLAGPDTPSTTDATSLSTTDGTDGTGSTGSTGSTATPDLQQDPGRPGQPGQQGQQGGPVRRRRDATIYLHLTDATLTNGEGLVRCESLGPLLLGQLTNLLGHANVTVRPVIDLNHVHAVNSYEHPAAMRQRVLLRTAGDAFPHSPTRTNRLDLDHVVPFDPGGPPGQTADRNTAPLTRLHHRVKTHQPGWQVTQLGLGAHRWITPHGLCRVVTPLGTRQVDPLTDQDGNVIGEIYWE